MVIRNGDFRFKNGLVVWEYGKIVIEIHQVGKTLYYIVIKPRYSGYDFRFEFITDNNDIGRESRNRLDDLYENDIITESELNNCVSTIRYIVNNL